LSAANQLKMEEGRRQGGNQLQRLQIFFLRH
jgi:hypothetical protein